MKHNPNKISNLFCFMVVAVTLSKLTYGEEPLLPLDNDNLYCPGYANCSGMDCHFVRIVPSNGSKTFEKGSETGMTCDSLEVQFDYPDSKDSSFTGKESWTCYRYYDGVGHHLVIATITINKPSDVETSNFICKSSIGNCTLLNDTSSELQYVAGLPDMCFPGLTFLPSQTDLLNCEGYSNCTGDSCKFNRTLTKGPLSRPIYVDTKTVVMCDSLEVDVTFPLPNKTSYDANETFSCYAYKNENGSSFTVAEMTFNKPSDIMKSDIQCKYQDSNCVLQNYTSTQVVFYAGVPTNCTPWTPPTPTPETTTTAATPTSTTATDTSTKSTVTTTPKSNTTTTSTTVAPTGNTTTKESSSGTTPGVEVTTKGKGSTATNLEGTTLMIVVAAVCHFLSR